jgi:hypothetical protein
MGVDASHAAFDTLMIQENTVSGARGRREVRELSYSNSFYDVTAISRKNLEVSFGPD